MLFQMKCAILALPRDSCLFFSVPCNADSAPDKGDNTKVMADNSNRRNTGSGSRNSRGRAGSTGSQRSSGSGSSYQTSAYMRRKKRRDRERRNRFLVGTTAVLLVAILAVFAVRSVLRNHGIGDPGTSAAAVQEETTTVPSTELKTAVTINDIDITGMSRSEAKAAILAKYRWNLKAQLENPDEGEEPVVLSDLLNLRLERILSEIYDSGRSPKTSYQLDAEGLDGEIGAEAAELAKKWDRKPVNGAVSGFDKETNTFSYSDSKDGRTINQEKLAADIRTAMKEADYDGTVTVSAEIVKPELSAAEAKEKYKVIGTYTTKATANADRNNNLKLACAAVDGKILQVGEEFSFNLTTGNRTEARGYKPAGAYQNGMVVQEPGGGVCQVSSTLYNAVIRAGITPTERHAHTFEPSYVTPGEDATVSYDGYAGPDMKFVNTTNSAIAIRASFYDRTVTVSIIGIPVLDEGVTISLKSSKTEEFDNGGVEYVEDQTLQPGVENVVSGGSMGSRWVTNIVTKKDGEVISDVFFHNSTYKGHSKTIARNTSGVVIPAAGSEVLTIVENTETAAEQAGDTGTEGTVQAIHIGPGETVMAPVTQAPATASPAPGPGHAITEASTTAASPAPTAAAPAPAAAEPAPTAAAPAPAHNEPGTTAGNVVTPAPSATEAAPAVSGPGAVVSETPAAAPGGGSETVAPFPGG